MSSCRATSQKRGFGVHPCEAKETGTSSVATLDRIDSGGRRQGIRSSIRAEISSIGVNGSETTAMKANDKGSRDPRCCGLNTDSAPIRRKEFGK
jgi:hypothetical protein